MLKDYLVVLLEACPGLESLTLQAHPEVEVEDESLVIGTQRRYYTNLPGYDFGVSISPFLRTLTLIDFHYILFDCRDPVPFLTSFRRLELLRISLHSDLHALCKDFRKSAAVYIAEYVANLRQISAVCPYLKMQAFDHPQSSAFPLPIEPFVQWQSRKFLYLRCLGWDPTFDWSPETLIRTCIRDAYTDQQIETTTAFYIGCFRQMADAGLPASLSLRRSLVEYGEFFFGSMPAKRIGSLLPQGVT